jgi:hypothetical protein
MRRTFISLSLLSLVVVSAVVACGGSDDTIAPGTDGGTGDETTPPPPGGDGGGTDAAEDGEVTDGGANIDPDAGGFDDGGPDGGPCNTVANAAPAISSSCISIVPVAEGGALVAGKYYLAAVAVLGTPNFCKNTFIPIGFRETLDLAVGSDGVGTAEIAFQIAGGNLQHRTTTFAPSAGNASPATATTICPANGNTGPVAYTSALRANNKQIVSLRLPYGAGEAIYRFEKQ